MKSIIRQLGKGNLMDLFLFGTIAGTVLFLFAFAPKQQVWTAPAAAAKVANPIASNAQSIAAGKVLYIKNCNDCHGKKGKGDGPKSGDLDKSPKDFTKEAFQSQADGILFWKMTEGRKPMPSFKKDLSEEQRWQVINYVRTLGAAK